MSLFDWIDDKLFDIHWHFTEEREIRKSQKRFADTMDEAIKVLESVAAKETDSKEESPEKAATYIVMENSN